MTEHAPPETPGGSTGGGAVDRDGPAADSAGEMAAAIAAMVSFQQVTQQADAKAGTMVTVHVGLAAIVATRIGSVEAPTAGLPAAAFWAASAVYAVAFVVSGHLLVQVIKPRTGRLPPVNRFALRAAPGVRGTGAGVRETDTGPDGSGPAPPPGRVRDGGSQGGGVQGGRAQGGRAQGGRAQELTAQVWEAAQALAEIARRKNGHMARAIMWVAAMVSAGAVWLVLAGAGG